MKTPRNELGSIQGFEYELILWYTSPYQKIRINAFRRDHAPSEVGMLEGSSKPSKPSTMLITASFLPDQLEPLMHPRVRVSNGVRSKKNPRDLFTTKKKDHGIDRDTEVIATMVRGIDNQELNVGYRKTQIRKPNEVMATKDIRKLYRDQKKASECYYISLMSLGNRKKSREYSSPNKVTKRVAANAMVVLFASIKQHGRSRLEPTSEVVPVPLGP
ncbi:hypothetical protein Cgig2_027505 [Carnegiea gigantea]|uniref:Uncharacterized protein n=1 Tax=Carnegiea gigantea TaxID=171969 RepID=A0A9Q1GNF3_9CARY|nr:hypothetical protein Cgig2_027505 [Carnegiea gigantea]